MSGIGLISKYGNPAAFSFSVQTATSGTAYMWVRDVSNAMTTVSAQTRVDDSRWHHLAARRLSNTLSLFVDGKMEGSVNISELGSIGSTGSIEFNPGTHILDEVRISNIARQPFEFNLQLAPKNLTATATAQPLILLGKTVVGQLAYYATKFIVARTQQMFHL